MLASVAGLDMDLREVFIVSQVSLAPAETVPTDATACENVAGAAIGVSRAKGEKCARCWVYYEEMAGPQAPDLCPRCAAVLAAEGV